VDGQRARRVAVALSDGFVVVNSGESSFVFWDLTTMDRFAYETIDTACKEIEGFSDKVWARACQLGSPGYVVRWANPRDDQVIIARPWPHQAQVTLFEPDQQERDAMALRVLDLLEIREDDAQQIAANLLNCFGTVETPTQPARRICCIDLRPLPGLLNDAFGPQLGYKFLTELAENIAFLVDQWSPRFVDARVLVPMESAFPES
jgi:hypothetical protein